ADLPTGTRVNVTLSVDQKTARSIFADGPQLGGGVVKAVDAGNSTLTFDDDKAPAPWAGKTLPVARDARIRIDGKEPCRLADLPKGAVVNVNVALCVDQKTVRYIDAWGRQFDGVVKAVDAENSTLTVDEKGAETTWPVTKDARIRIDGKEPCKLADL